ncbi:MAG: glycosyltransferase family 4 protein [Zestosphaera sp.]
MDLRVLMVSREYGDFIIGGAGNATTLLTKYLRLKNVDVHVLSFGDPDRNSVNDNYIAPLSSVLEESKKITSYGRDVLLPYDIYRFTKKARELIRALKPDVVHVQEPYVGGLITYKNKITTIHDTSYGEIRAIKEGGLHNIQQTKKLVFYTTIGYFMEHISLINSKMIIVPSSIVKSELVEIYDANPEKVTVIHNGVEIPRYTLSKEDAKEKIGLPENKIMVFTTAHHTHRKRLDILIIGLCMLCREKRDLCENIAVIVGGRGYLTDYLKSLSRKCGLNNIHFIGWIPRDKLQYYFMAADIYVFTSSYESAPLAILEACAYGLPIITTNTGDYALMMRDHEDALIVPRNNVISIKNALIELITDEGLRKKLSINARKFAERFSWERVAEKHIVLYEDIIEERVL